MKHVLALVCAAVLTLFTFTQATYAASGDTYTVQPGDTLSSIAFAYGLTVDELLAANGLGWDTWVYAGQQLIIPSTQYTPAPQTYNQLYTPQYSTNTVVTVQPGETLSSIAARHGVDGYQLAVINGLAWNAWLYAGQQLIIPTTQSTYNQTPAVVPITPQPTYNNTVTATDEKWIDVDLTNQTITAYEGQTPVYNVIVSTGTWKYPTVAGTYKIYVKYEKTRMSGGYGDEAYDLADVPYVMYFYKGYGIHGTYWHNNFGTPMSHGCVNLTIADAGWFYNWASIGTKVVTHY